MSRRKQILGRFIKKHFTMDPYREVLQELLDRETDPALQEHLERKIAATG